MRKISPTLLTYIISVVSFIFFQLAFTVGKIESYQHDKSHAVAAIEKQIVGDLDDLPIPNEKLHIMGKPSEVNNYIYSLNKSLLDKEFPVEVVSILPGEKPELEKLQIMKSIWEQDQTIWITLTDYPMPFIELISIYPILATLLIYVICLKLHQTMTVEEEQPEQEEIELLSWLQIDLKQKKLINLTNQNEVDVANKPLCFFSALIDYCQQNPEQHINPNKELPDELISLSNKYFFRLIDLGHTIRKRPNFTNNLEKTLSEIRAALDEIFEKDFEKKEVFYPPKAIGEGSRSKAHSFALSRLDMDRLEFVGK